MLGHRTRVRVVNRPKVEQVTDHPHHLSGRWPRSRSKPAPPVPEVKSAAGGCRRLSQLTLLGGPHFHTFAVLFHRLNDFRNAGPSAGGSAVRFLDSLRSSEAYLAIDRSGSKA
jgi:hypothetical protein